MKAKIALHIHTKIEIKKNDAFCALSLSFAFWDRARAQKGNKWNSKKDLNINEKMVKCSDHLYYCDGSKW